MKYLKSHIVSILLCISIIINLYLILPSTIFYNDDLSSSIVGTYRTKSDTYDNINGTYTLAIDQNDKVTLYTGYTVLIEGTFIKKENHYLVQTGVEKYIFQHNNKYIYFAYTFNNNSYPIFTTLAFEKVGNIPSYQVQN